MNCSMLMLLSLEELRTLRRSGVEVSLRSTQIKPTFPLDQFHALTGQILLGCLVPRPILGRARRLLEGSRGVWGGGPKETSEK